MKFYIGVEIGGTKQQVAVVSEDGAMTELLSEKVVLVSGAEDILNWLEGSLNTLLTKYPEIEAIGVGFGGIVETKNERLSKSVQVRGWENFRLKDWFEKRFNKRTVVVNDTVAGGYGELLYGTGKGFDKFFYTNIGTGIGGATFIHGKPYDGTGYGSSYFGHTYVPVRNPKAVSQYEYFDKLENYCSGVAIEKRLRQEGYIPKDSLLYSLCGGNTSTVTCSMLANAANNGDSFALGEIESWAYVYSIAMSNYITLFSPERVAIGGGVANMGDLILKPVRKYVGRFVFNSAKGRYDIVQCKLLDDAVLVGAAMFARDGFHPL
ncbi:MAG: ROK family protein [Acetivibrionales bacterium]|jgi:glucokinase